MTQGLVSTIRATASKLEAARVLDQALKDGSLTKEASYEVLSELVPLLPVILSESLHSTDDVFVRCFGVHSPLLPLINKLSVHFILPFSLLPPPLRQAKLWRPLASTDADRALSLPAKDYFLLSLVLLRVLPDLSWTTFARPAPPVRNFKSPFSGFLPAGAFPVFPGPAGPESRDSSAYDRVLKEHLEISSQNFRTLVDWVVVAWLNSENDVFGFFSRAGVFESLISLSGSVLVRTPTLSRDTRNFFTREISMLQTLVGEEQSLMSECMLIGNLKLWKFLVAKLPKFQSELLEVFVATIGRTENFEISDQLAEAMVDAYDLLVSLVSKDLARDIIKNTETSFNLLAISDRARDKLLRICTLLCLPPPNLSRPAAKRRVRPALADVFPKFPGISDSRSVWKRPPSTAEFTLILPLLFVLAKSIDAFFGRKVLSPDDAATQFPRILAQWRVLLLLFVAGFMFFEDLLWRSLTVVLGFVCFIKWTLV